MIKALVVTDPMCSWCWGMANAVEEAAHELVDEIEFDLLLGGINTHATQPIGDYGRRLLMKIWREVAEVTGQNFGFRLPEEFVYNSRLPCVALEAIRRRTGLAPFGFLHRLQQGLFAGAENINDPLLLDAIAVEFGWRPGELQQELTDETLHGAVREQFAVSRSYGTNALPAVLVEEAGQRRLLLGGYADSAMLIELLRAANGQQQP
jgi:putative protein-disulfide isomerase